MSRFSLSNLTARDRLLILLVLLPILSLVVLLAPAAFQTAVPVLALAIVLACAALAIATRRFVVQPAQALMKATKRLTDGDLSARTEITGAGPLTELAGAFDTMADTLQTRQAQLLAQAQLLELAHDAIIVRDPGDNVVFWNQGAETMYGWSKSEALGQRLDSLLHTVYPTSRENIQSQIEQEGRWEGEIVRTRRDGGSLVVSSRWAVQRDESGEIVAILEINSDVTERKRLEEQVHRQGMYDALTGLPNRVLFMDRVAHALARTRQRQGGVAVLFVGLDRFASINDSLGHNAGDALLGQVSERLMATLRAGDTVARFGGDEFTILVDDISHPAGALSMAERLIEELRRPFRVGEHEVFVSASAGIAIRMGREESGRPEALVREASIALQRAKAGGKSCAVVFDSSMHSRIVEQLDLEADLHRAVVRGELRLHYQPIVELSTARVIGTEALIRWEHPQRGLLAPADFISIAEETGLIVPIGQWVLGEACRQARSWEQDYPHLRDLIMSVNLSAWEFQQPDLVDEIASALRGSGLQPGRLELEITETMLMEDAPSTEATLSALRDLGVRLAIDDFGTGYASLSYLHRFRVDALKIDRSFVSAMHMNEEARVIAGAITALGHSLGLEVTAEGIETAEQLELLRAIGCERGQGYYFARPVSARELAELLGAARPLASRRAPSPRRRSANRAAS